MQPELSIIVPLYDEAGSLEELHRRLVAALAGRSYEILFVDDGSKDGGPALLDRLAAQHPGTGVVHLRRNFGKAAALDAGFRRARGKVIVTLDADLQDLPEEIPRLTAALDAGPYDCVSGWKKTRRDPWHKRLPSLLFNRVVRWTSGLALHDFNCGLKAYRVEATSGLELYGEMHRYIPVLLHFQGFSVSELAVGHAPRLHGRSKYGLKRLVKGFFDLLTVLMNTRYRARPLHLFGLGGLLIGGLGVLVLSYLTYLWFTGQRPIGQRPLLLLGLLLVVVGVQLVSTGLLGELVHREQHRGEPTYLVRDYQAPRTADPGREAPKSVEAR